jgi:hypothetical protein
MMASDYDNLEHALHLHDEGFCVIPLRRDGSRKIPAVKWAQYQHERPTNDELYRWFGRRDYLPAIVTGRISGITVIDCDSATAAAECERRGVRSSVTQRTRRGVHLVFRFAGERCGVGIGGIPGVDRRGEAGYVCAYPDSRLWTREAILSAGVSPDTAVLVQANAAEYTDDAMWIDGEVVWDDYRQAWRHDYTDTDGRHSLWIDGKTYQLIEST